MTGSGVSPGLSDSKLSATDHSHVPSAMAQNGVRGASSPEGLLSYSFISGGKAEARHPKNELFIHCGWEEERRISFH